MDERNEKQFTRRSGILLGLFALCLLSFGWLLYDAQVVNYETHLTKSTTQVTTTKTVETTRGIITDRNGKILVSNQEIYAITIDPKQVRTVEGEARDLTVSRAILRLIKLCQEQGVTWSDGLPLSQEAPFSYVTADASPAQRTRLQKYLQMKKWSDSALTAETPTPR